MEKIIFIAAVALLIITTAILAVIGFIFIRKVWAELFKHWNGRDY